MDDRAKNDRDFFRIATGATMFGMAVVGGFLGSIKGRGLKFELGFSIWTIHGTIIGAVLGWAVWKIARAKAEQAQQLRNSRTDVTTASGQRHNS